MRELHRFLRGMVAWVGYPQICVRYERQPRVAGTTKYPLSRMIRLAWNAAVSFSPLPLRMSFFAGGLMALLAIEEAVRALVAYLHGRTVPGWTSLMIVLCMSNAALLVTVGILGEYVGRIFEESKGRPLYIVADAWNVAPRSETQPPDRPLRLRAPNHRARAALAFIFPSRPIVYPWVSGSTPEVPDAFPHRRRSRHSYAA